MERIIKVNGVEVVKGLCTVDFRLGCSLFNETTTITHSNLYNLLNSATKIENCKEDSTTAFVKFNQGDVTFIVYKNSN